MRAAAAAFFCSTACAASTPSDLPSLHPLPPDRGRCVVRIAPMPSLTGYWARTAAGPELSRAFGHAAADTLRRAGCETDDDAVYEVRVSADLRGSLRRLETTSTIALLERGRLVDSIDLELPIDGILSAERYPDYAAVHLVNALLHSAHWPSSTPAPPLALPAEVAGDHRPIVAAFDVLDASGQLDEAARDQLSEYIAVRLTQSGRYRILPRRQVRALLVEEKAGAFQACVDEACQLELGKALAAEKTLSTTLIRVGAHCALTATLFDLRSEAAEHAASVKTGCAHDALLTAADALIEGL